MYDSESLLAHCWQTGTEMYNSGSLLAHCWQTGTEIS
jgi:hypothetical protein